MRRNRERRPKKTSSWVKHVNTNAEMAFFADLSIRLLLR